MNRAAIVAAILALIPVGSAAQAIRGSAVTTASPEALALYQKAVDYIENIEYIKARPLLDEAIQKDPGFAMAYLRRAEAGGGAKVTEQNLQKAVSLIDKVSPAEREWILVMKTANERDLAGTKQHMEELLKLSPDDQHAALFAGGFYRNLGEDTKSKACLERATSIDPGFAAALNQLGYLYIRLGDHAAAETTFKKYIAARPDSPNPYDSYAELLLTLGRYDDSIAQYNAALTRDPAFSSSLAGLGHNYVFKGDSAKARDSYGRMYDAKNPNSRLTVHYWTAVSYLHEGRTDDALKTLDESREAAVKEGLIPGALNIRLQQTVILLDARRTAAAESHLVEAGKLLDTAQIPDRTKTIFRRQIELQGAMAAAQAKDRASAQAHLDRAKAMITPGAPEGEAEGYETASGAAEFWLGNYDAALEHFKKAGSDDAYAMFYTAEAMRLKGDRAGAAALYKKVVAHNQNSVFYGLVRSRAMKAAGS